MTASAYKRTSGRTATDSEERVVHVSAELKLEVCPLRDSSRSDLVLSMMMQGPEGSSAKRLGVGVPE